MKYLIILALFATLLFSTGCTNMNRTQQGALSGAAMGAAAGIGISALSGGAVGVGAAVGGAMGGIAGGLIGNEQEHRRHRPPRP